MKTTISLLSICFGLILGAVASPPATFTNTVILSFNMVIDPNGTVGMTPSDYATNFNAVVVSSPSIAIPTNLWPVIAVMPVKPFLSQGPPGTIWTNPIPIDGANRFLMVQYTNISNGGVGPFSIPYPLLWSTPSGGLGVTK